MIIPQKWCRPVQILVYILSIGILAVIIKTGFQTVPMVWKQTTPVLKISMGLVYAAIPVGALFMLINTIFIAYYQIIGEEES